jgi:hypothetical protein
MKNKILAIIAVLSLTAHQAAVAQMVPGQFIGAAGAVKGGVNQFLVVSKSEKKVVSGDDMGFKDTIKTDAQGKLQVLLLDETVFTLGPDTELVMDEYVYDPKTNDGKITASLKKGVFRFVTGKVARKKPSNMKIKLPVGTIGIRGTIGAAATDGTTALVGLLGPGENNNTDDPPGGLKVSGGDSSVEISRQGFGTLIPGPGMAPLPPFMMTPEQQIQLSVAAKAQSGGDGPGGSKKAGDESGDSSANAKGDLRETSTTNGLTNNNNALVNSAVQDGAEGGTLSQWDEIRNHFTSGSGSYASAGTGVCNGGSGGCQNGGPVSWDINMTVNFGSRQISGSMGITSSPFGTASASIGTNIDFSSLNGDATVVMSNGGIGNLSNANFNGTRLSLLDAGSPAGQMKVDLAFSNGSETANGSITANKS